MNKSKFFVLFLLITAIFLVSFSAVLADQEGNRRWCNSDQYGCWITGDNGNQDYIMFWSESARDLFMGPGSSAGVVTQFPAGRMPLDPAPKSAAPAPAPAPVDPEEEPEEELTTDQKVSAIIDYVLDKQLFGEIDEDECKYVAGYIAEAAGDSFKDAVDDVYKMIQEGQDATDVGMKIDSYLDPYRV